VNPNPREGASTRWIGQGGRRKKNMSERGEGQFTDPRKTDNLERTAFWKKEERGQEKAEGGGKHSTCRKSWGDNVDQKEFTLGGNIKTLLRENKNGLLRQRKRL